MDDYDPAKAHEYYERTKQLKGRDKGSAEDSSGSGSNTQTALAPDRQAARAAAAARVKSLNGKLAKLQAALKAARAKSSTSSKSSDKPSAGEANAKQKAANKQYYAKHKNEIANDRKAEAKSTPEKASAKAEPRGIEELESAIRNTLGELKAAIAKLKSL
jgi:hypothetical protein